jgi:hypothetical protein
LIEHYDPTRGAFSTYLRSIVRLAFQTFLHNLYSKENRERMYELEETTDILSREAEAESESFGVVSHFAAEGFKPYQVFPAGQPGEPPSVTRATPPADTLSPKQREVRARKILLLACKAGCYLDDRDIERVAELSGYELAYVRNAIDIIRSSCLHKQDRIRQSREKHNGFYIRSLRCLHELRGLEKDSPRREQLEKEYQYCRKRQLRIRLRAERHQRTPSNRLVSTILGINRGTVDATLASAMKQEYPNVP